jgi:hypothetical protein
MYSLPHHHPGVEAIYVLEGEACYKTPTRAVKLQKGETLALPGDTPMRAVVTGTARRHVLAVIVHDAAQPATMRMESCGLHGNGRQVLPRLRFGSAFAIAFLPGSSAFARIVL